MESKREAAQQQPQGIEVEVEGSWPKGALKGSEFNIVGSVWHSGEIEARCLRPLSVISCIQLLFVSPSNILLVSRFIRSLLGAPSL